MYICPKLVKIIFYQNNFWMAAGGGGVHHVDNPKTIQLVTTQLDLLLSTAVENLMRFRTGLVQNLYVWVQFLHTTTVITVD